MTEYPTDLTPAEQALARARLGELAGAFAEQGGLPSPVWREVFLRTWRHPYVPAYYPDPGGPCVTALGAERAEWLDAVYSDRTLITKVVWLPMSRTLRPGAYPMFTSSSTLPSLVLSMLEALDVVDGSRVLEIGTGSGYNAALLCERLGSERVTSLDIDPELVELAAERLAANGYTPTLAAADGVRGYPGRAPYDRIIATCGVPAIPPAWLAQAAPGAVILADLHGALGGTLVKLTVGADGVATGRFVPYWAGFMWMRHTAEPVPPDPPPWPDDAADETVSPVDPGLLTGNASPLGFVAQWHLPGVSLAPLADGVQLTSPDGSAAIARARPDGAGSLVSQVGPVRLWNRVEDAHKFWLDNGQPGYDRFGLTATPSGQYVWYDQPDSAHRWSLPVSSLAGSR